MKKNLRYIISAIAIAYTLGAPFASASLLGPGGYSGGGVLTPGLMTITNSNTGIIPFNSLDFGATGQTVPTGYFTNLVVSGNCQGCGDVITGSSTAPSEAAYFVGTSTTATSTFLGSLQVNNNLMVGTTSSARALSVQGSVIVSGNISSVSSITATGTITAAFASTTVITSTGGASFATTNGNVGIGTTSPYSSLSIQSGASTGDALVIATSTQNSIAGYDNDGHRFTSGPAPSISSCGTGTGTVVGDDQSGAVTTATAATACTLTFSKAYRVAPTCTVTDNSLVGFADISSISTSAVTFGISSALTGGLLYYGCNYHK